MDSDDVQTPPIGVAIIETDTFCERCGFNLHTQRVWRDGRLGILVCRCPECGAHQAAGKSTTTTSAWLNRAAMLGLLVWIGVVLMFVVAAFFVHLGIVASSSEELTTVREETLDGRPIEYGSNNNGVSFRFATNDSSQTPLPPNAIVRRAHLIPLLGGPADPDTYAYSNRYIPLWAMGMMTAIYGTAVFTIGVIVAAATWFWRRGWRWVWIGLPVLAGLIGVAGEASDARGDYHDLQVRFAVVIVVALLEIAVLGLGLIAGRRIARFLVSVIIPPKSRQLFAFLWHADGLEMRRTIQRDG